MVEPWQKTQELFSKIIKTPPLIERYLKRPSPEYIFTLIMNTMKVTGFPKGLYTSEEENVIYFMDNINNQKKIIDKAINITRIATENNFEIDSMDILQGLQEEKTHIFLQNFYLAATTAKNKETVKRKFLLNIKEENFNTSRNKKTGPKKFYLKTSIISVNKSQEIPLKTEQSENIKNLSGRENGYVLWIDEKVFNFDNISYYKSFKENRYYNKLNLKIFCFNNLDDAFDLTFKYIKFKLLFIIVSGKLYPIYYQRIKESIKLLRCLPICIIFTSPELKKIYIQRKKLYYLTDEILDSINNSFYNLGGVSSDFNSCMNFIFNFCLCLETKIKLENNQKYSYDNCITFECVYSKNQLVIPFIYNELISEEKVTDNEINLFKNFLLINHREEPIIYLILPMLFIREIPREILSKYFLRAYTEESSLYREMNNLLMKRAGNNYQTFIKIIFEGLNNQSLSYSEDDYLYRGTKMSKIEIEAIINLFEKWKEKTDKSLPSFIIYSRCFLSFSKDKNQIINFIGREDDNNYGIVFILKNNDDIINKYSSNADIEFLSKYSKEKEVLFFPFSTFCLHKIYKGKFQGVNCIIIKLEYLGKYSYILEDIKKDENFKNTFINTLKNQNYLKDIINTNIINEVNDSTDESQKDIILKKVKNKIKLNYDLEINELIQEDNNNEQKMLFYNIIEKNDIKKNTYIENKDITIDNNLVNAIRERNKKKENKTLFFSLTSFKLNKMVYMWDGQYNKKKKKHGIGKEYDFDDNVVFDGEYLNGLKVRGIEYYILGTKKFEGNYKDGKRWNGILYDTDMQNKFELKEGNGYIKEFHENGCLSFEGEIKDGEKNGNGKIYDECGHLLFEGNFKNGIKNGLGKIYNQNGDLIFDGEIENDKQMEGTIYKYNDKCELLYKIEKKEKIKYINKSTDLKNYIEIDNGIWYIKKNIDEIRKCRFERKFNEKEIVKKEKYDYYGN